jgi:hypothetical protein
LFDAAVLLFVSRAGLNEMHQRQFLHALQSLCFVQGDYVVREGEDGDRFYIITSGEVVVTKSKNGVEENITHLYEGHFFGETSLVKNEPRNANVKVISDTLNVMSIGKDVFTPFLEKEPGFRRFIDELVAKKEETSKRRMQVVYPQAEDVEQQRNDVRCGLCWAAAHLFSASMHVLVTMFPGENLYCSPPRQDQVLQDHHQQLLVFGKNWTGRLWPGFPGAVCHGWKTVRH